MSADKDTCHCNKISNSSFPVVLKTFQLPLDCALKIMFTGYFNGVGVEVTSNDEMPLLYHMGCFGKGLFSRSKPRISNGTLFIMRKRQFHKRDYWFKKFVAPHEDAGTDIFLKNVEEFTTKILHDSKKHFSKNIIDLVSSDEDDLSNNEESCQEIPTNLDYISSKDTVVIVPNSDSEDENYFANLKPKCCINKIIMQEKLMLTLLEAFFLMYGLGCLQIIHKNEILNVKECWELFIQTNPKFIKEYVIYHYFRSKGYVVKPGLKFGGDFLLYKEGPSLNHADYIVVIKDTKQDTLTWVTVLGHVRMAGTAAKEIIIAEVIEPVEKDTKLPESLSRYKVRELLLTRKMPINTSDNI